jgi:hypothetical protein
MILESMRNANRTLLLLFVLLFSAAYAADDKPTDASKVLGKWSGDWVDNWQYKGQGGKITCTLSEGKDGALQAIFTAPGFLKDPVTVSFKLKPDGDAFKATGSVEMGKPAGAMTFNLKLTGDKFSGDYLAEGERGTFEMERDKEKEKEK